VPLHEIYLISAAKSFVNFGAKKKNCGARFNFLSTAFENKHFYSGYGISIVLWMPNSKCRKCVFLFPHIKDCHHRSTFPFLSI